MQAALEYKEGRLHRLADMVTLGNGRHGKPAQKDRSSSGSFRRRYRLEYWSARSYGHGEN